MTSNEEIEELLAEQLDADVPLSTRTVNEPSADDE